MRRLRAVVAATGLHLALTACGAGGGSDDAAPAPSPQPATGAAITGAPPGTTTTHGNPGSPGPSGTVGGSTASQAAGAQELHDQRLGKAFTYADGLRVRIDRPEPFTPSKWVERQPGTALRFSVTVRNDTGEEFNPSQLHIRLRSPFTLAGQIFDYENGVVARPEDRLRAGRTVRFSVGYWVSDPEAMVLEFAPGFGYQSTVVSG